MVKTEIRMASIEKLFTWPRVIFCWLVFSLALLAWSPAHAAEPRTALVIGNSNYANAYLKNPKNDARAIANQLRKLNFEVITTIDADLRGMRKAINDFGRKLERKKGVGLFYYAGHGMQSNGRNYLIPLKANLDRETDLEFEAVDFKKVLREMDYAGNGINIAILDACRDSPLSRGWSRSAARGLARADSAGDGTLIVYSTSPGQTAADGEHQHSPFTQALLDHLPNPDLTITSLFNKVGWEVKRQTRDKQVPWTSSTPLPEIYLAGGSIQTVTPTITASSQGELSISTEPAGATILVDGGYLGPSPQTLNLPAGKSYRIEARQQGLENATETVRIESGKRHQVKLILTSQQGYLTVQATPIDARIQILNIGPTYQPGMALPPGRYHLKVSKSGYAPVQKWIQVFAGQQVESVVLQQEGSSLLSELGIELVTIPAGSFQMGSDTGDDDEKPVHRVTLRNGFKMMRHEVTRGQFRQFAEATGYRTDAEKNAGGKEGCYAESSTGSNKWDWRDWANWKNVGYSQADNHPVACISYNDAKAFADWLARETGQKFRLPSESEWEYAARAGSQSDYSFGSRKEALCRHGNGADQTAKTQYTAWTTNNCEDGYVYTAPVGSFQANSFGLYDMHGNVWEWTQDCWNDSYQGSPGNGSVWTTGDCGRRVLRGGSWGGKPNWLRSANRTWLGTATRSLNYGFRLVQGQ